MGVLAAFNYTAVAAAAVTGVTAVAVGLIGYFTAKLSAKVAIRQTEEETARATAARTEEHLQHRQGIYHRLLNQDRSFFRLIDPATDRVEISAFGAWYKGFIDEMNAVILFGTASVPAAAVHLNSQVASMVSATQKAHREGSDFNDALDLSLSEGRNGWDEARRTVIDRMREDVAPDTASFAWESKVEESDLPPP